MQLRSYTCPTGYHHLPNMPVLSSGLEIPEAGNGILFIYALSVSTVSAIWKTGARQMPHECVTAATVTELSHPLVLTEGDHVLVCQVPCHSGPFG